MRQGNLPSDIMKALSTPDRPVSYDEFQEFWDSLTTGEKIYYRHEARLY